METQKAILVTGGSTGFGRLTAQTLAREGYTVFASMRDVSGRNAAASAQLRTLADKEGLSLQVVELDVTDAGSVQQAVAEVIDQAGRIDVLVNNAGIVYVGLSEAFTLDQAQRIFDTNFFGVVRMNRAVLPHMRQQGSGLLVHISSVAGRLVLPFMGLYGATKFALEALAESYRYELSSAGIDSVIVEPGGYPTNITNSNPGPADRVRVAEYGAIAEIPEKMFASLAELFSGPDAPHPQEVADVVADLIAMPAGARPLRTLVGRDAQAAMQLNQVAVQAQRDLMEQFGMAHLMRLPSRDAFELPAVSTQKE